MSESSTMGASVDAVEFLVAQHRELEQLWSQLQLSHENGSADQERLSEEIVKLLSQHDAIETQFLYPELRDSAGDEGTELSDHSLGEHQRVRELLTQVDGKDIRDEGIFSAMSECISTVMHHVEEEEQEIFPLLRAQADEPRLMQLGERMSKMMAMAPTHPHPHTPDNKIGATIAGAVSGMVDKARDTVREADKT